MSEKENPAHGDWMNFPELYKQRKEAVGPECLTVERLEDYLHRTASEQEKQRMERHLSQCDRCAVELEYLKAFTTEDAPPDLSGEEIASIERTLQNQATEFTVQRFADPRRAPVRLRWGWWSGIGMGARWIQGVATLAASVALLFVGVHYYKTQEPRLPAVAGPDSSSASRGRHIELISPLGTVPEAPRELNWQPVPNAAWYKVHITEIDGTLLWSATVSTPKASLPADIAAQLVRAKTYRWFVEAEPRTGVRARSEQGSFIIGLPPRN